jgi:hypothetical protein
MSDAAAKTVEKGPAAWSEEPVTEMAAARAGGTYDAIMALQRGAGNRAVGRLLGGGSGWPLDPAAREEMEARFGADFSDVRLHRDETAAKAALAAGARAITTGRDIVFGEGYYAPSTTAGKRLIAHELAHVLQQRGEGGRKVSRVAAELEARQAGADVAAGKAASVEASAAASPQADPIPAEEKKEKQTEEPGWYMVDAKVSFWISHQIASEASFLDVGGRSKESFAQVGSWSNPRVFTISQGEHTWLHLMFFPDTTEHQIPAEYRDKLTVFTDIHYTPANGGQSVDLHFRDNQPQYRAVGAGLSFKLGSTAPGQSDLPICDLQLDGGGELTWKAGFGFGTGSISYEVKKIFSLQKAPAAPPQTTGTGSSGAADQPGGTGAGTAQKTPQGSAGGGPKPQLLPQGPTPKPAPNPQDVAKANALTEAYKKAQEAVKKDQIVKELRDVFSRIQPFMPQKDAKKAIDDAIDSLVKTGLDEAIKAILKGFTGKDPSAVDPNRGPQTGPISPTPFPSPQVKIPLPLPGDNPPPRPKRHLYDFKGLKKTYTPGEDIKFTVEPPDDFVRSENPRLVIVAEKDRNELNSSDRREGSFDLESKSPTKVQMKAPEKPGKYVIRVETRGLRDPSQSASDQDFEVTGEKKSQ